MHNCRLCKSDLQPFFANTPKQNAQIVDCVDLRIADLQPFFANTPKRNAKIVDCVDQIYNHFLPTLLSKMRKL